MNLHIIHYKKYLILFLFTVVCAGCAGGLQFKIPEPVPDDTRDIPQPKPQKMNYFYDAFNKIVTLQVMQSFDFARQLRLLSGRPKEAFNIDAFDEVANSSWFTNRNARKRMSLAEIARGPDRGDGPDTTGVWTITAAKAEGVTPGFHIEDSRGDRYVIKFDPPGYSELATGAEMVCTKIFYAMGYNVPENYITYFYPRNLVMGENVTLVDEKGRERLMNRADIDSLLTRIHILPDGRIRALASKYVQGIPIGGFHYNGTRKDDPNDVIPHEHRRELRGLEVPCSWLKHFDTKAGNNLTTYVNEDGRHYVKHFLMDFGATLGSATHSPQDPYKGHEYDADLVVMMANILSLGLIVRDWEKLGPIQYPSIGRFDAFDFRPGRTKHNYQNPAFENCTDRDGFWGAKLVMSFTDEQIQAAVKQGRYSDPDAAAYLTRILIERRDKSGLYWFSRVNPLDDFILADSPDMGQVLEFTDLGVKSGLWSEKETFYKHDFEVKGLKISDIELREQTYIPLNDLREKLVERSSSPDIAVITIFTSRENPPRWSRGVEVFLARGAKDRYKLLGIHR